MTDLERFIRVMAKMMKYCLEKEQYVCSAECFECPIGKVQVEDDWSPITPEGELTPEVRKWWEQELPEAWEKYLFHTEYLENSFDRKSKTEVLNAQLDWRTLWKWMCGNKDEWMYEHCPEFGNDEYCRECPRHVCNGTGRVARWDVEKWLDGKDGIENR